VVEMQQIAVRERSEEGPAPLGMVGLSLAVLGLGAPVEFAP
jgi:hypothetical protein